MVRTDDEPDNSRFTLAWGESVSLATMQITMMQADLAATRDPDKLAAKQVVCDQAVAQLRAELTASEKLTAQTQFVSDLATAIESDSTSAVQLIADHGRQAPHRIDSRSRSLLLLVDLVLFDPWPAKLGWNATARRDTLRALAAGFPAARESDLDAMLTEHRVLIRRLRRKNVRWGRVAVAGALGLGIGVATAGWAAPLIGTAIGTAAGLSGAAATSAGLATLGGGAIAAGGFGVAGGTALVTGVGGIAVAGVAATGARWTPWTAGQVVVGAMRLDLINRVVLSEDTDRDEQRRRVVLALHQRLETLVADRELLIERIRRLSADNKRLTAENRRLRDELRREREQVDMAESAIEVVLSRIPESAAS
ncbi:hypothetical protein BJY24_007761 [Nocardia transvalensis]|uniref:Uncharacterized protein n=1 Tax=Nocardia transvalensis TaxID=37333 RepID=A0A7W9PME1_9NOCA|nr:hypothetical protein [Nocardia transvalensis]MBB5918849.1 hypothetical protein [Nocardia transvalensis]